MVTKAELKKFAPGAKAELVDAIVSNWDYAEKHGINTPARIQQFFANIAVETGGITKIVESLTYTSAQRIYDIFKGPAKNRRFKSVAECKPYVRNPVLLGIKVYGGRMGNKVGPATDGFDYRGGGMLQTTGREGYRKVGYETNPQVLQSDPVIAFKTAVDEWAKRGCNALADAGKTTELRAAINGGSNGLEEVKAYLVTAKKVWPASLVAKPAKLAQISSVATAAPIKPDYMNGQKNPVVLNVQTKLDQLGYHEVGTVDGKWGDRTAGAITTFQGDIGLATNPVIDDTLLSSLMTAEPRKIAPARANATVADLREEGAKDIVVADKTQMVGAGSVGLATVYGVGEAADSFEKYGGFVKKIADTFEPIKGFVVENLWLLLGVGGAYLAYLAYKQKKIRLEKHQSGEDLSK